ncbi:MAG: tetratricopeptide repeat protein [Bacteroidia bacterium]|nr:tetratricopeptide repeat protein [Bacteroidia bacterium]
MFNSSSFLANCENPKYRIYYNEGVVEYNSGNYDKAIKLYSKSIEINPEFAPAYNNRGLAYYKNSEIVNAIKDFDMGISIDSSMAELFLNKAIIANLLNAHSDAIKLACMAIDLNDDLGEAYSVRGLSKIKLNDSKGGCKDLFTAREKGLNGDENMIKENEKLIKENCNEKNR